MPEDRRLGVSLSYGVAVAGLTFGVGGAGVADGKMAGVGESVGAEVGVGVKVAAYGGLVSNPRSESMEGLSTTWVFPLSSWA